MHQRRYIQHSYRDHSQTSPESCEDILTDQNFLGSQTDLGKEGERMDTKTGGGESARFPSTLHSLLERSRLNDTTNIISWQLHGRAFKIHKPKDFLEEVVPIFFQQTKLASFRRQLNLYGFLRISQGPDKGSYYNELFLRGKSFLAKRIIRVSVKGNRLKGIPNPDSEPDFYNMPFMDDRAQGQSDPTLSSTSNSFSPDYTAMPIPAHSPEFHPTATRKGFQVASCNSPDSSALEDNRNKICIDSSSKIVHPVCRYWELDSFSLEDTIFHDYMKDCSSQEEDIWSIA